ncbi:MAG: hypothetical protein ACYSVY_24760 [Planctomycetota bacterium]
MSIRTQNPDWPTTVLRTSDNGSGAPATSAAATIFKLSAGRLYFDDELPNDGATRHYLAYHQRPTYDTVPSTSHWVGAAPVVLDEWKDPNPAVAASVSLTKTLHVPFCQLVPQNEGMDYALSGNLGYVANGELSTSSTAGSFSAPVFLPVGVTITGTRLGCFIDSTDDYITTSLYETGGVITFNKVTLTSSSLSASAAVQIVNSSAMSITVPSVAAYVLDIGLRSTGGVGDVRFYYYEVDYTMPDYAKAY